MSEMYCEIVLFHENPEAVRALKTLFSPLQESRETEFGEYHIESGMIAEHVIIAYPVGLLDSDKLMDVLSACDPDWLYVSVHDSGVGHEETWCFRKGHRKTTQKTLLKAVRERSEEADLYFSIANQEKERLGELLKQGIFDPGMKIDGTPLFYHVMAIGGLGLLKLAIRQGADIHALVERDHWIEVGDQIPFQAIQGMNLLSIAIGINEAPIVKFLLNSGIDVNAADRNGDSPLNIAAKDRLGHKFIEPLVNEGGDINHENRAGYTPLFSLLEDREYNAKKMLAVAGKWIELGADIRHQSSNGLNALWLVLNKSPEVVDFVRSQGVTEYRVPDGYYDGMGLNECLGKAMTINDVNTFEQRLDVDALDKSVQASLLHDAAYQGRMEIIRIMLEQGIKPYLMDRDLFFAHQKARESGNRAVADYLKAETAGFLEEAKSRIKTARPLYDSLMVAFETVTKMVSESQGETGSRDLSPLEMFQEHPFMQRLKSEQLEFQAGKAVSCKGERLTTKVNDEFEVIFQRGDPEFGMAVKISTNGKPKILDIGKVKYAA
ncbi:ankyrin repeat domain-containing protein [Thiolapillus brandeum]|uniref:Ankyrin repeat domain-containing protein n=1 Tax=Thiolapillus brandeum TaxID=1076588 RepID=A0A7U6JHX0_9GAMM|nr:ankyrin repeat domain-containing protein [Thiolapillus brandeum]BAO44153.1 hypothetical protein TBH_C1228 [Thiolapillus brandeum]